MKKNILFILLILSVGLSSPQAQPVSLDASTSAAIDRYLTEEMKERQIPGLALAVCYRGKILKEQGYGLADVKNQVPVTPETVFELASITKQFTASAIMLLKQEGKVQLDESIHTYLPDAPEAWQDITVRHLLTHTSGLPDMAHGFSGFDDPSFGPIGIDISAEKAYRAARADTLTFTPGEKYTYSDVGYFLLGLIVQEASGMSYREFMQTRIFGPVGMSETYVLDQVTIHPREARGYTISDGELVNIRRVWNYEVPSHYGVFSTVGDLARWDSVLYTDQLLTPESKTQMWSPMILNNGRPYPYGFGWKTWTVGNRRIIDHTGITGTEMIRLLDDRLTVIVLTNLGRRGSAEANPWGLAPQVAAMMGYSPYLDKTYVTLSGSKMTKGDQAALKKLTGTYRFGTSDETRKLYVEDGQLFYDRGESRSPLVPLNDGRYLMLGEIDEWILEELPTTPEEPARWQWLLNQQPAGVMQK